MRSNQAVVYYSGLIILTGSLAYILGRLEVLHSKHTPIEFQTLGHVSSVASSSSETSRTVVTHEVATRRPPPALATTTTTSPRLSTKPEPPQDGKVIGVLSSKKYYFPWCATVQRLKETSVRVFDSVAWAKLAGYSPAKNCKGMK